jgi:hypothetical protein
VGWPFLVLAALQVRAWRRAARLTDQHMSGVTDPPGSWWSWAQRCPGPPVLAMPCHWCRSHPWPVTGRQRRNRRLGPAARAWRGTAGRLVSQVHDVATFHTGGSWLLFHRRFRGYRGSRRRGCPSHGQSCAVKCRQSQGAYGHISQLPHLVLGLHAWLKLADMSDKFKRSV